MPERDATFDKPIAYEEDGKVIYRASSLGMCTGALVRARLGVTGSAPSDMMQTRFDEGTDWEAEVIAQGLGVDWVQVLDPDHLAAWGTVVAADHGRAQVQTEVAWGNKVVRCHPDGIVTSGSTLEPRVLEAKFLSPEFALEKIKAVDKHGARGLGASYAWQLAIEMLSTGLPALYVIGVKDAVEVEGERVVRGVREIAVMEFDEPPYTLREVKARVLEIEGYVARGEIPACPVPLMYPCPFWMDHEQPERVELDDDALVEWVEVWRLAKQQSDEAAGALDEVREQIRARLEELEVPGGVCKGVQMAVLPSRPGNVSWAKWAAAVKKKYADVKADEELAEDRFRGADTKPSVKIEEAK